MDAIDKELQAMLEGNHPSADGFKDAEKRKWLTVAEGQKTRRIIEQAASAFVALAEQFDRDPENPTQTIALIAPLHAMLHGLLDELHTSMGTIAKLNGVEIPGAEEGGE